jgi:hypothetical protein
MDRSVLLPERSELLAATSIPLTKRIGLLRERNALLSVPTVLLDEMRGSFTERDGSLTEGGRPSELQIVRGCGR